MFLPTVRCTDTGAHPVEVGFARPFLVVNSVLHPFAVLLRGLGIGRGADSFRPEVLRTDHVHWHHARLEEAADGTVNLSGAISAIGNGMGFDLALKHAAREGRLPEREFALVSV